MMKSSQAAQGQTSGPTQSSSQSRNQGSSNDQQAGYRNQRNHQDGVDTQPHGQRSKSTSHHHANGSNRDGATNSGIGNSEGTGQNSKNAQPRSQSHAKGPTTVSNVAARDNSQSGREGDNKTTSNANAVGHYILGKALGEGTFGKVKLGTHVLTGEKVAVKVLEKSKIKDKKDVERISREIKILKQLHHPNVVQIYEIIETDKDLYLVMEFASGGELFELIVQNQRLKERTASKHLQELLSGVHYIHQLGICHRDLKPENLLLDFDGQLKIVDFGLSNMYEQGTTLKTACGSPCYAAPEMIAGNRYHGLKSDIWSCGVVLYAMLCGYLPFEDQKTSNLYKKIMNAEYSLPKFLSAEAKDILSKIFVTDPSQRIDIDGLKQHPWYRLHQPENQNYNFHNISRTANDKLVMKMEASLGFSIESVQKAVENNKHNHLSATYYLLLKKYAQASFKTQQSQRNTSVQVRVDSRNPDYQSLKQRTAKTTKENSDSKNRAVAEDQENSGKGTSSNSQTSSKYGKFRNSKETDRDRLKAPVQDQLVLKNHRREQSANATAGRHIRNGDWGRVQDERRTGSYERPAVTDDYEILVSKANKNGGEEGNSGERDPKNAPNTTNMRQHFISPSPDNGPLATRHRQSSVNKSATANQNSNGAPLKAHAAQAKQKPMEVNIQNIKSSFNQVSTPSQVQTRVTSLPKQSLPKPATFTQATVTSQTRSSEKQKQTHKSQEHAQSQVQQTWSQPSQPQNQISSHHRKTKSIVPELQKQQSLQNTDENQIQDVNKLVEESFHEKEKFSQTQKIQSKSSGQQPRQQMISLTGTVSSLQAPSQSTKVSELMGNLNMMSQQKTYFDQIASKNTSGQYIPSKQSNAQQAAGIEGKGQLETVVNVNVKNNGGSSGIFQSLASIGQRPIIQDANSQNLLRRLESGTSDNQLKQNFVSRQSQHQQTKRKDERTAQEGINNDSRGNHSPLNRTQVAERGTTLHVDDPRNGNSRLSAFSYGQNHFLNQPVSKTPVTGFQTLDTMGDMSSHEIKIPVNPDTDLGVSKSIFYGTQKIKNLNQEIQRHSHEQMSYEARDFSKTQSINISLHSNDNQRGSIDLNDRNTKNVILRTDSSNRVAQPKVAQSTKHQRNTTSIINKKSDDALNNSQLSQLRQNHNGYSIPTQSLQAQQYATAKTSHSKFQSLKVSSNPKVPANHLAHQSSIEHQGQTQIMQGYAHQNIVPSSGAKKAKETIQKTRSLSVSGAQKSANLQTPASHRKGNSSNQANSLIQGQVNGVAAVTLAAHYRCSTASSTNKERRSSQPPQASQHGQNSANAAQGSTIIKSSHKYDQSQPSKQRSSSSQNYQSTNLVKSIDGRFDNNVPSQRTRQRSTRDPNENSTIIQQIPQDRQFQSITHGGGPKTSILTQQLEETILSQSFNGSSYTASRYQPSSSTNYNKRKQQVASITELLNVAESLKQNYYNVRPRQSTALQLNEASTSDIRLKQNNYFTASQVSKVDNPSQNKNPMILSQSGKTSGGHKPNQPVVVSDLGINLSSGKYQPQVIQSELKANMLLSQQQQMAGYNNTQSVGTSQNKQHQSLTTAMKQITDGLMQRNSQMIQQQNQPPTSHQSYLSDLFTKQLSQNQMAKQQQTGKSNNSVFLNQQVLIQTQPIGLKANLYSPTSSAKSTIPQQKQASSDLSQELINGYAQRVSNYSKALDPQAVLYSQQIQQSLNQTQSLLAGNTNNYYQQPQYYPNHHYTASNTGKQQDQMSYGLQQQINQLNGQSYTPLSATSASVGGNYAIPPQQLIVSIQQQPQKPPSVPAPAPSTGYQQMLQQQLQHQNHYQQQQQQLNFYPMQGGGQEYI